MQDETITSVDARVPGSGCAKMRKTGAQTPPEPAQTGARAARPRRIGGFTLVLSTRFTTPTQRATKGIDFGPASSLARRVGGVAAAEQCTTQALTALPNGPLGRANEVANDLPIHPERTIDRLMQVHDESITSVATRVSGSGCAKMRKTGAQTAPEPAQTGANGAAASLVSPAPAILVLSLTFPKPQASDRSDEVSVPADLANSRGRGASKTAFPRRPWERVRVTPSRRASEGVGRGVLPSLARRVGGVAVAAERGAAPAVTARAAGASGCGDEGRTVYQSNPRTWPPN